jgi:tetratricopeptide (TPR) repeat protein
VGHPKDADYYNSRAWAYFKAGKAAQGLPDAEKSLELLPNDANTLDTRGSIFEALGRKEEAIAGYRRALSKDPNMQQQGRPQASWRNTVDDRRFATIKLARYPLGPSTQRH